MLSTIDMRDNDPHDAVEVVPDVVQLARVAAEFPKLAPDDIKRADRQPDSHAASAAPRLGPDLTNTPRSAPPRVDRSRADVQNVDTPRVDATFRATDVNANLGRSHNRWMTRAALAFVFALASGVGAAAWGRYGADAQAIIENFKPSFTLASWLPSSPLSGQPAAASAETTAAPAPTDQTANPAAPALAAAQPTDGVAAAAPAAAPIPDTAQLIQSMAHDVAALTQQLDDLKGSIAQLKAGQDQLTREFASKAAEAKVAETRVAEAREARAAEPNPHVKLGAPPRPLGAIVRRTPHPLPPAQAAYIPPPAAPPPVQIVPPAPPQVPGQPDADYSRPPMPVR
jgi:hypothetical protein